MTSVAERIAALNAKKKVEEPPPIQRKSVKWQKPGAVETETPVAPGIVSPQGTKPTPSWLKGNSTASATAPGSFVPKTSPSTSPLASPQNSPSPESQSKDNFSKIPVLDKTRTVSPPIETTPVVTQQVQTESKPEIPKKVEPATVEVEKPVQVPVVEDTPKPEEPQSIPVPEPEPQKVESKVVEAATPEAAKEETQVESVTPYNEEEEAPAEVQTPSQTEVVVPPPLPPSRKTSLNEISSEEPKQSASVIAEPVLVEPVAPVVAAPSSVEVIEEIPPAPPAPAAEEKDESKQQLDEDRPPNEDTIDSREKSHVMLGEQTQESRRSVRFGVGSEVKVEEFDYDDLAPGDDDEPPPNVDDAVRTRRRSSIGQKVVSILKRASRASMKKPEDDSKRNGISWG